MIRRISNRAVNTNITQTATPKLQLIKSNIKNFTTLEITKSNEKCSICFRKATTTMHRLQDATRKDTTKYRSDATGPTPQAVGDRRLSWSTKVFQLTPRFHQTHLLWEPSFRINGNGCLFSGEASSLDAFSSYPQRRGCPATALSDNRLTRGHSVPFLSY
jgi:hypothetical protein